MNLFHKKNKIISEVVILSALFGFAAGIVGQIVSDVYFTPWVDDSISQSLSTNQSITAIPELRRVERFLGIEQDFEVDKTVRQNSPSLAGVYRRQASSSELLQQLLLPEQLLGNAFILTSDGWLVTYGEVLESLAASQITIVYNNGVFSVDQLVSDAITNVVFIKISASNLPVAILGDSDENTPGQLAITLNTVGDVAVTNIKNPHYQVKVKPADLIQSTERYVESILVEANISEQFVGSPLLNLAGEVTGLISKVDAVTGIVTAVPINQFRPVILNVLRNNFTKRPLLGVSYIDLAEATGLSESFHRGYRQGALIYRQPATGSPAADAGLRVNDIIISVEGQLVDADNNLTELIQQYQVADELILEIDRDGRRTSVNATLALLPE